MYRTSLNSLARAAAAVLAALALTASAGLATAAHAERPHGSVGEVILEPSLTGDPTHAIHRGWWGHGVAASPTKSGSTYLSLDLADSNGKVTAASTATLGKLFKDKSLEDLRVAFVPYSADGSSERPVVKKGQNAGEVFKWFTDFTFGAALNGAASKNDSVVTVSTLQEWTAWWKIGRPLEGYLPDLSVVTIDADGRTAPAVAPEGKSILNRWPAGQKISMVLYLADGYDKTYPLIPRVAAGPDGRAISAWLTFRTRAHPTNPVRTSAGFDVLTYSPPSAYPGGGKGQTADGANGAGGSSAKNGTGGADAAGTSKSGSSGTDSKSGGLSGALGKVFDAVPGGWPVLLVLLALVGGGLVLGTRQLRTHPPQATGPVVAPRAVADETPVNGRLG